MSPAPQVLPARTPSYHLAERCMLQYTGFVSCTVLATLRPAHTGCFTSPAAAVFLSCPAAVHFMLRSEISEVISASSPKSAAAGSPRSPHYHALRSSTASTAAADAPAYRCAATGQESGSYCIVRNEQAEAAAAAQKAERWCMHSSMADAVPYLRPPPAFPFNSVPVGPSAPMG